MAVKKAAKAKAKAKKAKKGKFKSLQRHADVPKIKGIKLNLNELKGLFPTRGARVVLTVMEDGDGPGGKKAKPKKKEYFLYVPSSK